MFRKRVSQSSVAKEELFQNIVWNFLLQFFCGKGVAVHGYIFRALHGRGVRRMHRTQFALSNDMIVERTDPFRFAILIRNGQCWPAQGSPRVAYWGFRKRGAARSSKHHPQRATSPDLPTSR